MKQSASSLNAIVVDKLNIRRVNAWLTVAALPALAAAVALAFWEIAWATGPRGLWPVVGSVAYLVFVPWLWFTDVVQGSMRFQTASLAKMAEGRPWEKVLWHYSKAESEAFDAGIRLDAATTPFLGGGHVVEAGRCGGSLRQQEVPNTRGDQD